MPYPPHLLGSPSCPSVLTVPTMTAWVLGMTPHDLANDLKAKFDLSSPVPVHTPTIRNRLAPFLAATSLGSCLDWALILNIDTGEPSALAVPLKCAHAPQVLPRGSPSSKGRLLPLLTRAVSLANMAQPQHPAALYW